MIPNTIPEIIADLYKRHAELERRIENRKRKGVVHEIDIPKGLARVKLGEDENGKPYLSPWMAWKEVRMGDIKTHFPPSVGEHVEIESESGDLSDGVIGMSLPTEQNKRPHDKPAEAKVQIGETHTVTTGSGITTSTGHLVQEAGRIDHNQRSGGGSSGGSSGVNVA